MKMENAALIGLGAMGVFFAPRMEAGMGRENFCVIAGGQRRKRLETQGVTVNQVNYRFRVVSPEEGEPKDLIIMAVKDTGLEQAIRDIEKFVGENTQILCVMNGVESEQKVAAVYGWDHVLYSYMRIPVELKNGTYDFDPDGGHVYFGEKENKVLSDRVKAVRDVFELCHIPYRIQEDMILGLWQKFMSNIGENMTCALLGVPFKAFNCSSHANAIRRMGMKEVQAVAGKLGICLTDEMIEENCSRPFNSPYNRPSTLQDLDAGKKTEIDMFAGTVVRLGRELGVPTPANELFYHGIKVLVEKNEGKFAKNPAEES